MNLTDLTVTQTISAPAERIFEIWLDPKSPGGPWYGAERTILNPQVDGLFYFCVKHEGRSWPHYGRFVKFQRPSLIEYTWVSEATQGVETIVIVSFEPRGDASEVTLRHLGVPDDEKGRRHKDGWAWVLSTLAERFSPKP
jgi:uncharacterized protein YndB with AHSA1/START domain